MGVSLVLLSVRASRRTPMAKKTTEELRAEAVDLGIEVNEEWSYSELLAEVKAATSESVEVPDREVVEAPAPDPEPDPAAETTSVVGPRGYRFDSLGRFTG
jgi:hypothetical protein